MKITASAISLNVGDPVEAGNIAKEHLGFTEDMTDDGFVSLSWSDAGFSPICLRTGLESFELESMRGKHANGSGCVAGFAGASWWLRLVEECHGPPPHARQHVRARHCARCVLLRTLDEFR
jgi:hypothetical protein